MVQPGFWYSIILSLVLILGNPVTAEASPTIRFGLHSTVITELIKDASVLCFLTSIYYFSKYNISNIPEIKKHYFLANCPPEVQGLEQTQGA